MACSTTGTNVDKRELVRHEWFSCLVRIAIMRYVASGEEHDVSKAVGRLITSDILPQLDPWIAIDHQSLRREICYTEPVDEILSEHRESLHHIFAFFATLEEAEGPEKQHKHLMLMSLQEWLSMCKELELLDNYFTARDATVVFVSLACGSSTREAWQPPS